MLKSKVFSKTQMKQCLLESLVDPRKDKDQAIILNTASIEYLKMRSIELIQEGFITKAITYLGAAKIRETQKG